MADIDYADIELRRQLRVAQDEIKRLNGCVRLILNATEKVLDAGFNLELLVTEGQFAPFEDAVADWHMIVEATNLG